MNYKWKNKIVAIDAQVVGDILTEIHTSYGKITPDLIIKEGEDKRSPLHKYFVWDNKVAGNNYRKWQARALIKEIRIVSYEQHDAQDVRAFVSVTTQDDKSYQPIVEVLSNEDLRKQIILRAKKSIENWIQELKKFENFAKIVSQLEQVVIEVEASGA